MILNQVCDSFECGGVIYTIGVQVVATDQSEYEGLKGYITEIRDGEDKETENETPDIYCRFDLPDDAASVKKLETVFSDLYGMPKTIDELSFDMVIMAPEMIRCVP